MSILRKQSLIKTLMHKAYVLEYPESVVHWEDAEENTT